MTLDVLVIDDDTIDRMAIKRGLIQTGNDINVHEADCGQEALAMMKKNNFDCVFLDYMLPDMDGISLLRQIYDKETELTPFPITLLTGQGNESVVIDALDYGAQAYLIKDNVSPDTLNIALIKTRKSYALKKEVIQAKRHLEEQVEQRTMELKGREEQLKAVLDGTVDGIITIDHKGTIATFNKACEKIFGYTAEEAVNQNVKMLMPEPYHGEHDGYLKQYLDTGEKKIIGIGREVEGRRKNGTTFPLDLAINEINVEGQRLFNGVLRDVTEKKKAEEKLRMFEAVVEHSNDAVIITDANLDKPGPTVVYANDSILEITGYGPDEFTGNSPRILQGKGTSKKQTKEIGKALRSGKPYQGEIVNYTKDGQEYWLSIGIFPVPDEQGNITNFAAIERDVTQNKKAQEELQKAKAEAERANKAKDDFLANMSHELRTPLNSILGLTRILLEEDMSDEHRETLRVIDKSSSSLLEIVNDVLDLSKIESGNIKIIDSPFNITVLLESLIEQTKPLASQKGFGLKSNINELPSVNVIGDEFRLSRILINLIGNAVKYTLDGSVELITEFETIDEKNIMCIYAIKDTGIGIPADKLDYIFDKFTQAEEATERRFGGSGLGLNITKQLVELMGGTIKVESELGKGSVFTVSIPMRITDEETMLIDSVKRATIPYASDISRKLISNARVLVAEDHEFNQVFIIKLLNRIGCKDFHLVSNGREAIEAFRDNSFDMILMDCHMPEVNGYEASKEIRLIEEKSENEDIKHATPIIAMTADAMPGTREKCLSVGMNEYISKPMDESTFRLIMQNWFLLENKKLETEEVNKKSQKNFENDIPVNLDILDDYSGGDTQIKKELISVFYEKSLNDLAIMKSNQNAANHKTWSEAAHGLKGSAGYVGAQELYNLCEKAQNFNAGTTKERKMLYEKIEIAHQKISNYFKENGLLDN